MSATPTEARSRSVVRANDYVPAMRWKAGEMRAINRLILDDQAATIFPLFLIDNYKERQQNESGRIPTTPTGYIDYIAAEMQKTVGTTRIAFVDTHLFDSQQNEDGLVLFFSTMFAKLTRLIPVLRLNDRPSRREQIKTIANERGAALRLTERQIDSIAHIKALLANVGVDELSVDLIIDLEYLDDVRADTRPFADRVKKLLNSTERWRSFVLLSGAYPAKIDSAREHRKRFDWLSYVAFRSEFEHQQLRVPLGGQS